MHKIDCGCRSFLRQFTVDDLLAWVFNTNKKEMKTSSHTLLSADHCFDDYTILNIDTKSSRSHRDEDRNPATVRLGKVRCLTEIHAKQRGLWYLALTQKFWPFSLVPHLEISRTTLFHGESCESRDSLTWSPHSDSAFQNAVPVCFVSLMSSTWSPDNDMSWVYVALRLWLQWSLSYKSWQQIFTRNSRLKWYSKTSLIWRSMAGISHVLPLHIFFKQRCKTHELNIDEADHH